MERLKNMKEQLTSCVQSQLGDLKNVDAKELGEAVDMIKDLSEAIYYCTITEAMKETEKKENGNTYYYTTHTYPLPTYDENYDMGRMYYDQNRRNPVYYGGNGSGQGGSSSGNSGGNSSGGGSRYYEHEVPWDMRRDPREGKSPVSRRMYMESQALHQDQVKKMKELEKYMQELSEDITEMISEASPEEKQMLQQKISILATKIK